MVKQHEGALLPFIHLEPASGVPLYRQVQDQLRAAVLAGELKGGTRLPASRVLAEELGISRPTIVKVLENLKSEGYFEAWQGSGTFVAADLPRHLPRQAKAGRRDAAPKTSPPRLSQIGSLASVMSADLSQHAYQAFLPNHPAFDAFPVAAWRKCWNSAMRVAPLDALGYGDLAGYAPLRRLIAEYLALHRGDSCDAEQIVITPGAHGAFALAAMALANPGEGIWFEDPGPLTVYNLFRTLALDICLVGADRDGMDVETAIAKYPTARLAFVMPSRHHPLGVTLSLPRRLAMLQWARDSDAWIIEDDYDSEFRYAGRPLPSMRSIDSAERVIYVGTFSKALYPALRIGYLVLPRSLIGVFHNLGGLVNRGVPLEIQRALAEFIGGGHFVTHLRRMRELYASRRDIFLDMAAQHLGGMAEIDCPDSGMNALAWLAKRVDDVAVAGAAVNAGINCFPLANYTVGRRKRGALILGFSGVPEERMHLHFRQLAGAIASAAKA
jgi:GntR family transcriptional regulator/MocR family aminotransferase